MQQSLRPRRREGSAIRPSEQPGAGTILQASERGYLTVRGLHKSYGEVPAVRDVSLDVSRGEFFCLLGPSGGGKSTILHLIAGLIRGDAGSVVLGESDVTALDPSRRGIGLVFQRLALFPHMTVHQNVSFGLRLRKQPRTQRDRRVSELLELVGLSDRAKAYPTELSGGQQQRVALARALAPRPSLLLLDEPFSSLDARLRVTLRSDLKRIQRESATTTVMVTHDQDEAFALADRIAVINSGEIVQTGTPEEIYARPESVFVARFIGVANVFAGEIAEPGGARCLRFDTYSVPFAGEGAIGSRVTVNVRPEDLQLARASGGDMVGSGIPAKVAEATYRGFGWSLTLDSAIGRMAALQLGGRRADLPAGADVLVSWPSTAAVVLREGLTD